MPGGTFYDVAPDLYECNFSGYSIKFYWYKGKAYVYPYTKGLLINWPSPTSNITITTPDGGIYTFGAKETTTGHSVIGGAGDATIQFISAWNLTSVISPDKKDTILLSYSSASWNQYQAPYDYTYVQSTTSGQNTFASVNYSGRTAITTSILQSITCRNTQVNFITDGATRQDINGSYPSLHEIDVIDKITGNTVKKNVLSYEYFGQNGGNPSGYERLKLKQFKTFNPLLASDSLSYKFSYINEYNTYGTWPLKGTIGIDYWGYYNGQEGNQTLISNLQNTGAPISNRDPYFRDESYGVLDTLSNPLGGYTTFQYSGNYYNNAQGTSTLGPGLRIDSIKSFLPGGNTLVSKTIYAYSGGTMPVTPGFSGPVFSSGSTNYTTYNAASYSSGRAIMNNVFYYTNASEYRSSGTEIHRSDYTFNSLSNLFTDVRLATKTDYLYNAATSAYSPIMVATNNYNTVSDTSFLSGNVYLQTSATNQTTGIVTNVFGYIYSYTGTYWGYLSSQQEKRYDAQGNTSTSTTAYTYNGARNLSSTTATLADSKKYIQKFKYPEDYTSTLTGNMVASNILAPVIEKQTWLQKGSAAANLVAGQVTVYDQSIFKPIATYAIETTASIASLNNETTTSGKYNTLLSDSRYVLKGQALYDANNNSSTVFKTSDKKLSYIWDYQHAQPVAEVVNAAQANIAYTSFEADGKGNWTFTGTPVPDITAPTGSKAYGLSSGSISKAGLTSATGYIVSYWSKTGTSYSVSGSTANRQGKTINGWTYFEHTVTGVTSIAVSGSGNIDELRLYPSAAQMATCTYAPLIGISSQCDANNRITYYQYDGFERLSLVKDQDGNVVKKICYNDAGNPTACSSPLFYNDAVSHMYIRNNCGAGYTGSTVTYTVAANTYSASTKAAANILAQNDTAVNGQAYANTHGTCTPQSTFVTVSCINVISVAGYVEVYTNISTSVQYSFTVPAAGGTLGTIPQGTYNLSFTPPVAVMGRSIYQAGCNSLTASGTSIVTFSNLSVTPTTCNTTNIDAP